MLLSHLHADHILDLVPFAYALVGKWGPEAVWWSFAFGSGVALIRSVTYYRMGRWKNAKMLDRAPAGEPPDTGQGLPRERAMMPVTNAPPPQPPGPEGGPLASDREMAV